MPSIRHRSKSARTPLVLLAILFTFLAVIAVRPAAGLAAPEGDPPAEPQPPQLAFDPDHYDFALTPVNSGAGTGMQLRNTGTEAVHVDSVQIPGSEVFWANTDCAGPGRMLQPGESCFVQVYFNPHNSNEYTAQLRAYVGSYVFSAELTGTGGQAIFSPASNPTDFGVAAVGSAGTTREIAVTNTGNMPGGVFIAVISGGAIGSFQILDENCTGHPLAPARVCTAQVRFQPLSEGVKTATLSLFGEGDGGTQIGLTGMGSAHEPTVERPSASAPTVGAGAATSHRAKAHRRPLRIRRRHRRADLNVARRVLGADMGSRPEGR